MIRLNTVSVILLVSYIYCFLFENCSGLAYFETVFFWMLVYVFGFIILYHCWYYLFFFIFGVNFEICGNAR